MAKDDPVSLVGAPQCKGDVVKPREMTFAEGKKLSEIPADQKNTTMAWARSSRTRFWCIVRKTLSGAARRREVHAAMKWSAPRSAWTRCAIALAGMFRLPLQSTLRSRSRLG